jgi:hypothetical protein
MSSMYLKQLLQLTQQHGSLPEQQLVARWSQDIDALLAPVQRSLLNGTTGLEFGIEDSLTLKVILKSRGPMIAPALLEMIRQAPKLATWGQYVLNHQLRFHCGIKLTPERLTHELYAYPKDHAALQSITGKNDFQTALEQLRPLGIGIDDHRGYSMYYDALDTGWVETLRKELGLPNWGGASLWAWQQMRFDGARLLPGKTALELTPMPATVLARFASHYPFPYFRYLIPLKQHSHGNIGRDPVSGRFALYVTIN